MTSLNRARGPDYVAVALVPAQHEGQDKNLFYHVRGTDGLGMDFECRAGFGFTCDRFFNDQVLRS